MNESDQDRPPEESGRDMLSAYRERIMYLMAIAGVIFLTPFSINDLIQGRYLLGLAIFGVVATLGIDAIAIHYKRKPPIPFAVMLIPAAASIALSLHQQGFYGALWSYPAILFCYFVLSRRVANIGSFALLFMASSMVYYYIGLDVAVRLVVSLLLTIVIINIILNIIAQLQKELVAQAVTDPLTGAFNRRQMELSLSESIERNRRSGAPVSILIIDIDHFKRVNDDFGHDIGDRVLKALVTLIRTRSRKLDRLFRTGGEEFMLLLPDTRAGAAMKQADALRKLTMESKLLEQRPVTISIGVAEYWSGQSQEEWLKAADDALYQAKAGGRNMVVCGSADSESIPGLSDGSERRYGRG